jgi:hypothetical protein
MELKITVPTSLSDITLEQYKKYENVLKSNETEDQASRFVNLKMLEIFCGITYEHAAAMSLLDYESIVTQLYEVLQEKPKLVQKFKMGDSTFGFIPNLEEITFGEYIDLDTYIHDMDNIEKAMAVLYRPIVNQLKDKYTIQEYKGDLFHQAMLKMPMDAVVGSIIFFYNLGSELSIVMMNSLQDQEVEQLTQQDLAESGDGTLISTNSLKEILDDLKKSQI